MDHFNRHEGRKILPGRWSQEHEFAGRRARRILAKQLLRLNFPRWHGLCKETGEPPLGRAGGFGRRLGLGGQSHRHARGARSMENALLIGLSRQIALRRELETVANNIANLNTTGYKADGSVFEEFLMPNARHDRFQGADRRLSYVQDRATWHDFKPGPIRQTGSALDVAIEGDAFLVVQTPRGERYTRNGALQINATGQLVTAEGYVVQSEGGPIVFQNTDSDIAIADDGTIRVRESGDSKSDVLRGKLRLVRFDQVARLQKDGSSLFNAPAGVVPLTPEASNRVRVIQGALEQSNVRGVVEMSRMIELTRHYQQIANLLQSHGDMRRNSIDKL